jgi:hypothetical protein
MIDDNDATNENTRNIRKIPLAYLALHGAFGLTRYTRPCNTLSMRVS